MSSKTVFFKGNNKIINRIRTSCTRQGYTMVDDPYLSQTVFIATVCTDTPFEADSNNLDYIRDIYNNAPENHKLMIHLLVHSSNMMTLFQTTDLGIEFRDKIDIFPFTLDILCAHNLITPSLCNPDMKKYPAPERDQIDINSNKNVHVVIFGMNDTSQTLAKYIAHTCHYPNYIRDHSLRTRITIIDKNILKEKDIFINKYQSLFDNSFHRTIDLSSPQRMVNFHYPKYFDNREDFVDIEWEFVNGDITSSVLRDKLAKWGSSHTQDLSLYICDTVDANNIEIALQLPQDLHSHNTPIFIKLDNRNLYGALSNNLTNNIYPFGVNEVEYDFNLPIVQLAKMVNYTYDFCFKEVDDNNLKTPLEINWSEAEELWCRLSNKKRWSCIYNAMSIDCKMRILGHKFTDWHTYYSINNREIDILANIEHNRWNVEELILGFRPTTDAQNDEIKNDITLKRKWRDKGFHYDLRAFNDLQKDDTGKSVKIYDQCLSASIPLIASTYIKNYE